MRCQESAYNVRHRAWACRVSADEAYARLLAMAIETTRTGTSTSAALERYEAVIGIEVHCQLRTVSKMFCACSTAYDGAPPNTHVCPVCLGLPGALPVINRRAVEHVLATGLAIEATTPEATRWDRKNYFYPDLPKGYQISQYDLPLASAGRLTIEVVDGPIVIGITRAHLEEDTAKLVHATTDDGRKVSLIDFNRSGAPLMEIVTDPDIRTAEQARRYAEELQLLLRTIGASDADMERGQMRVEANVSLRPRGTAEFGTRIEVKNMNSFRSVERAIAYEIDRQAAALDAGEALHQETRGWSDDRGATYHMRSKETSDDYRYFPEPDLPPLHVDRAWLEALRAALPELPAARRGRYASALGLSAYDAAVLVADAEASRLFEATLAADADLAPKAVANWVTGEYLRLRNATAREGAVRVEPGELAALIRLVDDGTISRANAKEVLEAHATAGRSVTAIVEDRGFRQISDTETVGKAVDEVLAANSAAVADYRAGKVQAIGFLVGQVMKATRGQANAGVVRDAVRERLEAPDS
jgi:aspartyl-tRNA(Asn)/glutamyl-tRNA(Gln) amidotransferase subunit B